MKIKISKEAIIVFLLISTLNTCRNYQINKESKVGRIIRESIENNIEDYTLNIDDNNIKVK